MSNDIHLLTRTEQVELRFAARKFAMRHQLPLPDLRIETVFIILTDYLNTQKNTCESIMQYKSHRMYEIWRRVVARTLKDDRYIHIDTLQAHMDAWYKQIIG